MNLTNEDVADILALLDSLPYDELDLQTNRFRLILRRTRDGWTQSTEILSTSGDGAVIVDTGMPGETGASANSEAIRDGGAAGGSGAGVDSGAISGSGVAGDSDAIGGSGTAEDSGAIGGGGAAGDGGADGDGGGAGGAGGETRELVAVRAPLPGTFYRAPRPGAAPFVEAGSRVSAESVVGIVETMKLMNSVHAGVAGTVAEICLGNGQFAAHGATLVRIEVDP
jgi:acetyl-CoA carboxylase biotin carboxyl carrier protein